MLYDLFRITHHIHMQTKNWYGFTVLVDNVPTMCAGIYLITHIHTGRVYIGISGNLEKRIREHNRPSGSYSKLGKSISENGSENFLVTPIFYTLDNSADGLTRIESELIALHDSINTGYNVVSNSSKAGKRGEAFRRASKAGQNTPEAIAKRMAILADPEQTKKRGDAIREAQARPETKEKLRNRRRAPMTPEGRERSRNASIAYHNDPEIQARKSVAMMANHADPEFKAKHLAGVREANANPERNSKISDSRKGGMWITNGIEQTFIKVEAEIPSGWSRGRLKWAKPKYSPPPQ